MIRLWPVGPNSGKGKGYVLLFIHTCSMLSKEFLTSRQADNFLTGSGIVMNIRDGDNLQTIYFDLVS